jgi:hypothetical protein
MENKAEKVPDSPDPLPTPDTEPQSKTAEKGEDKSIKKKSVKAARLRLVFPVDDGSEQELDLGKLFVNTDSTADEKSGKSEEGNGHDEVIHNIGK